MNCSFEKRVSALIDNELSDKEARLTKSHIDECVECSKLHRDFLFFREELKEPLSESAPKIPSSSVSSALFKKWISIPVPAITLGALLLFGLSTWLLITKLDSSSDLNNGHSSDNSRRTQSGSDKVSLARFDRGGKAEVYTISTKAGSGNR